VTEIIDARAFKASGLGAFVNEWFARGKLTWSAGGTGEVAAHRVADSVAFIETLDPPGAALAVGAAFVITAGCDKHHATCIAKFENVASFRGFPHMPGNDAVQARPVPGDKLDGSSRWR
jgi:uncharacterized phage protein (TIGR02218 family)